MKKTPALIAWPFQTRAEAALTDDFLRLFRAAGEVEAWRLLDSMTDASYDGCYREDLTAMLREALAALPMRH